MLKVDTVSARAFVYISAREVVTQSQSHPDVLNSSHARGYQGEEMPTWEAD